MQVFTSMGLFGFFFKITAGKQQEPHKGAKCKIKHLYCTHCYIYYSNVV